MAAPTAGISADPIKFEEAIKAFRKRVPVSNEVWDTLDADELEFAFTVADVLQLDLVVDVYEAIHRAIDEGTTLDDFKDAIGASLEEAWGAADGAAIETIFRTNVMQSYNAGRHEGAQGVKDDRPFWMYEAIIDDRTSDICAEMDGTVLEADDPWWQTHYPPNHMNCRCIASTLTAAQADREGIDEYGPDVEPQDGFGQAPSSGGDFEPDAEDYPDDLAAVLEDKLDEDAG